MSSDAARLINQAAEYLPGGTYHTLSQNPDSAPEFLFSHGNGAYVYTTDGRRLLDILLGHGSLVLGHCPPSIVEAVKTQAERGNTFTHVTQPAIELAKMMVEDVPCADKVRFINSGTEASLQGTSLPKRRCSSASVTASPKPPRRSTSSTPRRSRPGAEA